MLGRTREPTGHAALPGRGPGLLEPVDANALPFPAVCMHELFEERARLAPESVAVVDGFGSALTYAELDAAANRLAHLLRELGVDRETLVGISVERSASMLVGLLAILKAGGAYVPIDPTYPEERVRYMLENSRAPVVVTEDAIAETLPVGAARVVSLDGDSEAIATKPAEAPVVGRDPESLAYVIYTSGSTGQPKGVEIPHRALVNFLTTMQAAPGLTPDDALLAVTTLSFDIAGLELYLPLVTGARVVLAPQQSTADPAALARLIEEHAVTVMQATPTTWRMLVDFGWSPARPLKALCGGEALPLELADALVERGLELWNMYGPTETTIWSTIAPITTRGEPLTIGRPIANTTTYVLDEELQPVELGAEGELYIGGAGLARGYRGRPDLTAERFVESPFSPDAASRLYRTGDLVRSRPDGALEYIGRLDHQVKVRGFRIELGEIENTLVRHPSVKAAVAMAREDTPGDARVVAYVLPEGDAASAMELREHAGRSLPGYMVPSAVVTLDAFPLTPNGKIDRNALPAPSFERDDASSYVAPRTPLETRLVKIWERVLGIEPIGVSDDFFELGVTSFVAAQLFAKIEREIGKSLPLGAVFQAPSVEQLAKLIEGGSTDRQWTSLVPMQPNGTKPPVFCVHGGAGTILHLQRLTKYLGSDQPFYALQSRGLYGGAAPLRTVEEMSEHYLAEIRTVQPHGPYYLAGYCFGTIVAFDMTRRLQEQGEEVLFLAMFNGPSPYWLRTYNWIGAQPTHRAARLANQAAPVPKHRKALRLVREPQRLVRWASWRAWQVKRSIEIPWARMSLALGRPLAETLRESYFLRTHYIAERAYEPAPIDGEIHVFSGEGLYEDIELGWSELARGGVRTHVVAGKHQDNRQIMREPHVQSVAREMAELLATARSKSEATV